MTIDQRKLWIAALALFCSAAVSAADAPKEEPAKETKAEEPAGPDLPSKPYPANATPKAFQPKKETSKAEAAKDKPAEKPVEKSAEKPSDKPADKTASKPAADKSADKSGTDKPADAQVATAPKAEAVPRKLEKKQRTGQSAQAKAAALAPTPEMQELAREAAARQKSASAQSYVVKPRDNLDSVIRKTLPANLFAADALRQAFVRANPALITATKPKLRQGQVLQVPDVATIRAVVMGEGGNPNGRDSKINLFPTSPVVAPTMTAATAEINTPIAIPRLPVNVAGSANPAQEVSPEEKKKWVRYP